MYEYTLVFGILNVLAGLWCAGSSVSLALSAIEIQNFKGATRWVAVGGFVFGVGILAFGAYLLRTL